MGSEEEAAEAALVVLRDGRVEADGAEVGEGY
jgi:hypothetical protein